MFEDMLDDMFSRTAKDAWEESGRQERLIFGNRKTLPADEMEIAFSFHIPFEQRLEKLTALRKAKAARRTARRGAKAIRVGSQTFQQRIDATDSLRARGMGVKID
jgi:hypothetical protein